MLFVCNKFQTISAFGHVQSIKLSSMFWEMPPPELLLCWV